jgi:Conserved region in glutamate synthase
MTTGDGGFSRYHREHRGDIIWEIGSGYFGCRNDDGSFSPEQFAESANVAQVKMVEIKLSQGAKPGHGGVLPGTKMTAEIAAARRVPVGVDCYSPARHFGLRLAVELDPLYCDLARAIGRQAGRFKLCIGHPWEFTAICKTMLETGIRPDFIVIDGSEGGTGAAPLEFTDHVGTPRRGGLVLARNCLEGVGLGDSIRLGASGRPDHRVRHGARAGAGRRLVQFGTRLHVRARLHSVAALPHRPPPEWRRDAEPIAPARPGGAGPGRTRVSFPQQYAGGIGETGRRRRPSPPIRATARTRAVPHCGDTRCGVSPSSIPDRDITGHQWPARGGTRVTGSA